MTLLLTLVAEDFCVQSSDRRLTYFNGDHEDEENKALIYSGFASFALTGLATLGRSRTDDFLMHTMARGRDIGDAIELLRRDATQRFRSLSFAPSVPFAQRQVVRRTSFVGGGFVGLRDPQAVGRSVVADELHPVLMLVSNAQDLTSESWAASACREFGSYTMFLPERQAFLLHVAGQPLAPWEQAALERQLRSALRRHLGIHLVARLLTRVIRTVAARNPAVGQSVMSVVVPRPTTASLSNLQLASGMIPLGTPASPDVPIRERDFFVPKADDPQGAWWIYCPSDATARVHYGPNFAAPGGVEMTGFRFGPEPPVRLTNP